MNLLINFFCSDCVLTIHCSFVKTFSLFVALIGLAFNAF